MSLMIIIIGCVLIVLNYIALRKDNKNFDSILKKSSNEFTEEKLELGRLRVEMGETITELQVEIERLNKEVEKCKVYIENYEKENEEIALDNIDEGIISEINFNNSKIREENENKRDQIIELINKGFTDDDICQKLSLGKGEVLLVRNLFKK